MQENGKPELKKNKKKLFFTLQLSIVLIMTVYYVLQVLIIPEYFWITSINHYPD